MRNLSIINQINYTKRFSYQVIFDYRDTMRIVFDLDGVICELKKPSESYADVIPKNDIIEKMRDLKEDGHYLIIHTGRMGTDILSPTIFVVNLVEDKYSVLIYFVITSSWM